MSENEHKSYNEGFEIYEDGVGFDPEPDPRLLLLLNKSHENPPQLGIGIDKELECRMHVDMGILSDQFAKEEEQVALYVIYGCLLMPICILGVIGNIMSTIVLTQKQMVSSVNAFLTTLAISDSLFLISCLISFSVPTLTSYHIKDYPGLVLVFHFLLNVFYTSSIYLIVGVTIDRYLAVCWPFKAKYFCTIGKARVLSTSIVLVSLLCNISRIFEVNKVK